MPFGRRIPLGKGLASVFGACVGFLKFIASIGIPQKNNFDYNSDLSRYVIIVS